MELMNCQHCQRLAVRIRKGVPLCGDCTYELDCGQLPEQMVSVVWRDLALVMSIFSLAMVTLITVNVIYPAS